ncbi:hypothetical protein MKW92_021091, partial [Papaver armeniacum]
GTTAKYSENDEPATEMRDKLLALDPLDTYHVIKVDEAEAEFCRLSQEYRLGWSDEILGFVVVITSGSQITASLLEG